MGTVWKSFMSLCLFLFAKDLTTTFFIAVTGQLNYIAALLLALLLISPALLVLWNLETERILKALGPKTDTRADRIKTRVRNVVILALIWVFVDVILRICDEIVAYKLNEAFPSFSTLRTIIYTWPITHVMLGTALKRKP